jgi:hypothetical protein
MDANGRFLLVEYCHRGAIANTVMDTPGTGTIAWFSSSLEGENDFTQPALAPTTGQFFQVLAGQQVIRVDNVAFADSPYSGRCVHTLLVDTNGGAVTVNFPKAFPGVGQCFTVKDAGGNAAVDNITLVPNGADTIEDGGPIAANDECKGWVSDGVSKWVKLYG